MGKKEAKKAPEVKQVTKKRSSKKERDIPSIIASFREELAKGTEQQCVLNVEAAAPTPRSYATLVSNPLNVVELFLFGGEYYDGNTCHFYPDFYKYCLKDRKWFQLPMGPPPRSSHQLVSVPTGYLYLFGGECSSTKESQFHHYKDFWRFDIRANRWEELEMPSGSKAPAPRSGHKMICWNSYLVLYGGFFDDSHSDLKYYPDDIWIYDYQQKHSSWTKLALTNPLNSISHGMEDAFRPSPRSGFVFVPMIDGVFLYGGYAKTKLQDPKHHKIVEKGISLDDAFFLRLNTDNEKIIGCWESVGKIAATPRSGISGVSYNNEVYLFGGIIDQEDSDSSESESESGSKKKNSNSISNVAHKQSSQGSCFSDLRRLVVNKRKCYPIELSRNIDRNESSETIDRLSLTATEKVSFFMDAIHPRYNAMIAMHNNNLFIYGGKYEHNDREYTLDDLYQLDLDRLNGFLCLQPSTIQEQVWMDDSSESDISDDSSTSDISTSTDVTEDYDLLEVRPNESLKVFFDRTQDVWMDSCRQALVENTDSKLVSDKAVRSKAFELAKEHFEEHANL
jgi:hypothetical protein